MVHSQWLLCYVIFVCVFWAGKTLVGAFMQVHKRTKHRVRVKVRELWGQAVGGLALVTVI